MCRLGPRCRGWSAGMIPSCAARREPSPCGANAPHAVRHAVPAIREAYISGSSRHLQAICMPDGPDRGLIDWVDGHPVSRRFGDVYFSRDSGVAETRHVFLDGNNLRERWARLAPLDQFCVGETGFGTGLNFACAWQLWDSVAPATARLHFVGLDGYPLLATDIARTIAILPELAM